MNNWRLLLFAVVAVLLPVGSFTERGLFDGRGQCCDHRSDFPDARLHGTYRKITQEDRRLSTRLLTDRLDAHDTRRHETRYANPLTERRFTESGRSVAQERRQRNLPEFRSTRIASSRRDLTRNAPSLDSTRRNSLENIRSERRTHYVDLNPNSRAENERRMRVRTERNENRKDVRPTEETIRHEVRLKNERVVLRLRENMRDSRDSRISEERREFKRMTTYAERRQGNQLRYSRESVERRDVEPQQERSYNQQSRDREFSVLRENRRREVQRRLSRDPLDTAALRMREIRSLDRLERVRVSRDVRIEAGSNKRLERTSERSRVSEDRMSRLSESRFRAEPQRTVSLSRVEEARVRLNVPQRSDIRKDERLEIRKRNNENRALSRNSVREDSGISQRTEVLDRSESERRTTNARNPMERVSEERRETRRTSHGGSTKAQMVRARIVLGERNQDTTRELRERSDIHNFRNKEVTRDSRADKRPDSRTEFRVNKERSLELRRNLDARNTVFSIRNNEREVARDRRSVDYRSGEIRLTRERSSLERSRNLESQNTLSSARNVRDTERRVSNDRRSVDDRSDSDKEIRLNMKRSSLERSRNLGSRNTLSSERNVRETERIVTNDRRSVDDRSDSRGEIRLSRERSNLERSRNLESRNARSLERNVRDTERVITRDRKSVEDISDSRRERLSRERSSVERNRNLKSRITLSSERNVRDTERRVTNDRRSVDDRSDSRGEIRLSRERSNLERSINLEARYARSSERNVRDAEREVTREQRSVVARSDSRGESSNLERSRNLESRNARSSERNVQDTERRITNDPRSVDDRSDSRREIRLSRERSNLDSRNARSSERNVRDTEREITRDRRSVEDMSDSRRERLSRERSSLERSRNIVARTTLSAGRNVRDNQRNFARDRKSVDRIDSRRETLDRSRSSETRKEREIMNRAVRNERQTQREHNERSTTIRPQIDRLVMERSDRNTESRNGNQAEFLRVRGNAINEKTETQDGTWQYMFYTLQGAYLCGLLLQMLTENSMKSKTKNFSWWLPASNNVIKVD